MYGEHEGDSGAFQMNDLQPVDLWTKERSSVRWDNGGLDLWHGDSFESLPYGGRYPKVRFCNPVGAISGPAGLITWGTRSTARHGAFTLLDAASPGKVEDGQPGSSPHRNPLLPRATHPVCRTTPRLQRYRRAPSPIVGPKRCDFGYAYVRGHSLFSSPTLTHRLPPSTLPAPFVLFDSPLTS